jgi:tRNA 2-thiouridine synthesizing protein E
MNQPSLQLPITSPMLLDEDGFFRDPDVWTRALAEQIADLDGIAPLTAKHWAVIGLVRDKFFTLGGIPNVRRVCQETGLARTDRKSVV